jgi:hypothetical protein
MHVDQPLVLEQRLVRHKVPKQELNRTSCNQQVLRRKLLHNRYRSMRSTCT